MHGVYAIILAQEDPRRGVATTLDNDGPNASALGPFVFYEEVCMTRDKVFKTYTQQRELLENRGLIINHHRFFTNCMKYDDYYNNFSKKSDFGMLKKHIKKCYVKIQNSIPQPILDNINREMGFPMDYLQLL